MIEIDKVIGVFDLLLIAFVIPCFHILFHEVDSI